MKSEGLESDTVIVKVVELEEMELNIEFSKGLVLKIFIFEVADRSNL